jgi:hypothetical protein
MEELKMVEYSKEYIENELRIFFGGGYCHGMASVSNDDPEKTIMQLGRAILQSGVLATTNTALPTPEQTAIDNTTSLYRTGLAGDSVQ